MATRRTVITRRRMLKRAALAAAAAAVVCAAGLAPAWAADRPGASTRLGDSVLPVIGCWFWADEEFQGEGYRPFLDLAAAHSSYNLLTTSLRTPLKEVTDPAVHDRIQAAAAYARGLGIGIVMDLDVRLARAAFQKAHGDELQEMLRLREFDLARGAVAIASQDLGDHYTFRTTHYVPLSGRLVRVYAYRRGPQGIEPDTLEDITSRCQVVSATAREVKVELPAAGAALAPASAPASPAAAPKAQSAGKVCVMVAFAHFTPDVFAPHLLEFQRAILRQYADTALAGACKDEWGFPPCFDGCPAKNDFWFSPFRAQAYAAQTGGRDIIADCLLMHAGIRGQETKRLAAINHFMEMSWRRNGQIETDFYDAVKATFGPKAVVSTHPTWFPWPGRNEFLKNGLDWWAARRDWAQTDEITPFCVRTSLAKKWNSPVWYNMYYASTKASYESGIWQSVLAGGRINFHPLYPAGGESRDRNWVARKLLQGRLTAGDCRIRLLNYISRTPADCPVAVVFGHAAAMNWAWPLYDDVGLGLTDRLWGAGLRADLIPSSEIADGALVVDPDGTVRYGPQRYAAVVLYHPQFERAQTAAFFRKAAAGKTALLRVGDWTADFDARPYDGTAALPAGMAACRDGAEAAASVIASLAQAGVAPQTPATATTNWGGMATVCPPPRGMCRLIDGTVILAAGEQDVAGDPIRATFEVGGQKATVDAVGVAAARLGADGKIEALAAGGLRLFEAPGLRIELDRRADLALWRDAGGNGRDGGGRWHGVLQGYEGDLPPALAAITADWIRLAIPPPLAETSP